MSTRAASGVSCLNWSYLSLKRCPLMIRSGWTPTAASMLGSRWSPRFTMELSVLYGDPFGMRSCGAAESFTPHSWRGWNRRLSVTMTLLAGTGTVTEPRLSWIVTVVAPADCEAPAESLGCELAPPQAVRPMLTLTRAARVGSRRVFGILTVLLRDCWIQARQVNPIFCKKVRVGVSAVRSGNPHPVLRSALVPVEKQVDSPG